MKKMEYLPFEIWEYNDYKDDATVTLKSDSGILYVYVGNLAICIRQSDDGLGVIIQALDAELCEQDLGSMQIWYDDIEKSQED
jgi:hypothetical protein